jgi:CrcB protein
MSSARLRVLAAVFAGGMVGTLARLGLLELIVPAPATFPWATFAANVAGAFLLGLVTAREPQRPFLGPGVCGALTTFSTLQLELLVLLEDGDGTLAASYALASVAAGVLAVSAGTSLGRRRQAVAG